MPAVAPDCHHAGTCRIGISGRTEPLMESKVVAVEAIKANGEGVRLSDAAQTSLVLFRRKAGELKTPELISDAAVAAWRRKTANRAS